MKISKVLQRVCSKLKNRRILLSDYGDSYQINTKSLGCNYAGKEIIHCESIRLSNEAMLQVVSMWFLLERCKGEVHAFVPDPEHHTTAHEKMHVNSKPQDGANL